MFPPHWVGPDSGPVDVTDLEQGFLDATMRSCPVVVIVVCHARKRAPASDGDVLGLMTLGCDLQNMWLTAEARGIGMQVISVFSDQHVEDELRRILSIAQHMKIAFACRLGYPSVPPGR
jgi:nitroreductase